MKIPPILRIALAVLILSAILCFVGFASNVWFSVKDVLHYGLWKVCQDGGTECQDIDDYTKFKLHSIGAVRAARACCGFGLLLVVVTGLAGPYYMARSPQQNLVLAIASILLIGGMMNCIGATVYLGTKPEVLRDVKVSGSVQTMPVTVGWGAVLTVLGGVGQIATSLLVILPVRLGKLQIDEDD
ncbi:hypothetical protein BaRGS_00023772 [Batillaria attramentaria]|uniref:Uncharacterized protein n=1 Tax=Batillaria attramentaria TaxID=370345 RepID=A0ABD0KD20_9CAEN